MRMPYFSILGMTVAGIMWAGIVWAQNAGGLPHCLRELAMCEAEPRVTFPGDGWQGPVLSYTDNGDGTATDENTLLMWEIKDDSGGIHDKDRRFSWSTTPGERDGTVFTIFLQALNNTCDGAGFVDCTDSGDDACGAGVCGLGGYRDWYVPNVKQLQSIVDYSRPHLVGPMVAVSFPGETRTSYYLTSTFRGDGAVLWGVSFFEGIVLDIIGTLELAYVRAVRGGQ